MAMKSICHTKLIQLISEVGCKTCFHCYFEANGQNHVHFWLIQVLKSGIAWHFLTFRPLSSQLEFVHPPWSWGVEENMLFFSSSSTSGWSSPQVEVNHRKPESLPRVLNLVRPLTELCRKLNEELKEKQKAKKKESE